MILLSRAEEIILLSVFKLEDNAYGVTIRENVYNDIRNYWSFGVIYKTLKKLNSKGYVRKIQSEPLLERGGRSKYFYKITKDGLSALEEIKKVHASVWSGVTKLA
ncbi:PadR family transcriptional regulator [candidate division KSB1 bacterium]